MRLCRTNTGLATHRRSCPSNHTAVTQTPEPLSLFCCPHCQLIFSAQHSLYTQNTPQKLCFLVLDFNYIQIVPHRLIIDINGLLIYIYIQSSPSFDPQTSSLRHQVHRDVSDGDGGPRPRGVWGSQHHRLCPGGERSHLLTHLRTSHYCKYLVQVFK